MDDERQEPDRSPEADVIAMIERSLVAVRRDQSRRRPPGPWGGDFPPGQHGPHAHHGPFGQHEPSRGWGPRGPWGANSGSSGATGDPETPGTPGESAGAFGDSARPGPGRRGRDGSLGRAAHIRMLEALAAADAEGRQLSISSLAAMIGVDQPRASWWVL